MAETMDVASIESGVIRIEWASRGGGLSSSRSVRASRRGRCYTAAPAVAFATASPRRSAVGRRTVASSEASSSTVVPASPIAPTRASGASDDATVHSPRSRGTPRRQEAWKGEDWCHAHRRIYGRKRPWLQRRLRTHFRSRSRSRSRFRHRYRSSVSVIGHRYRSSVIGHRSSVVRLNPQVSLGCASFGLRQPERHRYRSSKSMAETMDAASIESGVIRIECETPGGSRRADDRRRRGLLNPRIFNTTVLAPKLTKARCRNSSK
jgi:hypothetical protein